MSNPDPKTLSLSILISNMVFSVQDKNIGYRKECMLEIDRRFPLVDSSPVLETMQEDESSQVETQNFVTPTNFAEDPPLNEIEVDFEDIWNMLNDAVRSTENVRIKSRLTELQNIFQNPAIIKPSK